MVTNTTTENILRVIQQFEILRRDASDFDEGVRLQEMILDMKRKLAAAMETA